MPLVDVISEVQSGRHTKFIVEEETKNCTRLINEIKFMCNQQLNEPSYVSICPCKNHKLNEFNP